MPELFYLLNEVINGKCSNGQLEKQINLYDATAEEQSHEKVSFLSLEWKQNPMTFHPTPSVQNSSKSFELYPKMYCCKTKRKFNYLQDNSSLMYSRLVHSLLIRTGSDADFFLSRT